MKKNSIPFDFAFQFYSAPGMKNLTKEESKSFYESIPDESVLIEKLKELRSLDLSKATQDEIYEEYFRRIFYLPYIADYSNSESLGKILYRVRANVHPNEDLTKEKTFSYPDKKYCTTNGRANIANNPIFYCSWGPFTAMAETRVQYNSVFYIGEWEIKCNRPIEILSYYPKELPKENRISKNIDFLKNIRLRGIENDIFNKDKEINCIYDFWADIFMNEQEPYILSSWLANRALYFHKKDMLFYSSVQRKYKDQNFAIHPDFVDKHLSLKKVYQILNKNSTTDNLDISLHNVGEMHPSGIIVWRDGTSNDLKCLGLK